MIDRENIALVELCKLMAAQAALSHKLYLQQPYLGVTYEASQIEEFFSISEGEIELYTLRDQLYVCAPKPALDAVLEVDRKFRDWKVNFPREDDHSDNAKSKHIEKVSKFKFVHENMLIAMRNELVGQKQMPWPKAILDFLK